MTKAQFETLKLDAKHLALDIGLNPAARAMGIDPHRMRKWASRGKWNISQFHPIGFNGAQRRTHHLLNDPSAHDAPQSHEVTSGIEVKRRILAKLGDRTKLGFAQAGVTVAEGLAERTYGQLIAPATSISAEQWSKVADRTYGWSAERTGASVQVAVQVNTVSPEEREERRQLHAKLDQIFTLNGNDTAT